MNASKSIMDDPHAASAKLDSFAEALRETMEWIRQQPASKELREVLERNQRLLDDLKPIMPACECGNADPERMEFVETTTITRSIRVEGRRLICSDVPTQISDDEAALRCLACGETVDADGFDMEIGS